MSVAAPHLDRGHVCGDGTVGKESAVDERVKGLHASVEHFREVCHRRNVRDVEPCVHARAESLGVSVHTHHVHTWK